MNYELKYLNENFDKKIAQHSKEFVLPIDN
jgi:hypothetical protein